MLKERDLGMLPLLVMLLLGIVLLTLSLNTAPTLQASLLEERDLGVLLSLVTLLLGIVSRSYEGYELLVPRVVRLLHRLNPEKEREGGTGRAAAERTGVPPDYAYYGIPSPWLQVRQTLAPKPLLALFL
jgi:AP-2 complex subunit alpha